MRSETAFSLNFNYGTTSLISPTRRGAITFVVGANRGSHLIRRFAEYCCDSADKPVYEGTVNTTVARLFVVKSPLAHLSATLDLARCGEVYHRSTQDIYLVAVANSRRTIAQQTPCWGSEARGPRTTPCANVYHAGLGVVFAVRRRLAPLHVKFRLLHARVV